MAIYLHSILYLSPNTWKIWVNGKPFQTSKNLHALRVTSDFVQFMLLQNEDVSGITFWRWERGGMQISTTCLIIVAKLWVIMRHIIYSLAASINVK